MVNNFTDNDDPRWLRSKWQNECTFNADSGSLTRGQRVYITYRDPVRFKKQRPVVILKIRVVNDERWADLNDDPYGAPLWALVRAA